MILYTPLPMEQVMEGLEPAQTPMVETTWMGVTVEVEPLGNGLGRIARIHSSDPRKYLEPGLQPGTQIPLVFQGQS